MLKNRKLKLEDLITTALDDKAVQNDANKYKGFMSILTWFAN